MSFQGTATTFNPDDPDYSSARQYQNDMLARDTRIAALEARVGTTPAPTPAAKTLYNPSGTSSGGGGNTSSAASIGIAFTTAAGSILSVDPSGPQSSGTFTFDLPTQAANTVFRGPTSGGAASPTFGAIVLADLPPLPATAIVRNLNTVTANYTVASDIDVLYVNPAGPADFTVTLQDASVNTPNGRQLVIINIATNALFTVTVAAIGGQNVRDGLTIASSATISGGDSWTMEANAVDTWDVT